MTWQGWFLIASAMITVALNEWRVRRMQQKLKPRHLMPAELPRGAYERLYQECRLRKMIVRVTELPEIGVAVYDYKPGAHVIEKINSAKNLGYGAVLWPDDVVALKDALDAAEKWKGHGI